MRSAGPSARAVLPTRARRPAAGCSCAGGTAPESSLELERPADERIDTTLRRALHEVGRVGLERIAARRRRVVAGRRHAGLPLVGPCEITRSSVSRSTPCERRKCAAWLSSSRRMNTSRLPLSTCVALDIAACTTACWMTRSKPSDGSGSTAAVAGTGVNARASTSSSWRFISLTSAPQATSVRRACGSSAMAMSRCSRPTVSCRRSVARRTARWIVSSVSGAKRNRGLAHSASIVTSSGNSCSSASCRVVFTFVWATSWV